MNVSAPPHFFKHKYVHIKLNKDDAVAFRTTLFKYDLSMQEVLEEVIMQIITGSGRGMQIVNDITKHKMKKKLEGIGVKERDRNIFSEHDTEMLYDLIAEDEEGSNDE